MKGALPSRTPFVVSVLFGLSSSADRTERFSTRVEGAVSIAVQGFLFYSVVAAPALAVIGPLTFLTLRGLL